MANCAAWGLPETLEARADWAKQLEDKIETALNSGTGDVILVAHAHFLRVLTARRLGLPPAEGRLFQLATGTVSRLSTEHGWPVIAEWNKRP